MESNFQVGQYVLERPLGEGGMGEVWLGRHVHLGSPVAIKFLNPAYVSSPGVQQRFLHEGRRQGALNHPNIVKVYGFEVAGPRSFLILQYIDSGSLDDLLRKSGRLETGAALRIAGAILNALDYAHEHAMVHRDIKPSNILLDSNGFPYLSDFGIVLATNEKRLTRTGTMMGTALHMSPEQITRPGAVDRRSDIYSFGCVLYEMLAGNPPFNPAGGSGEDTHFATKMAHVQQPPPPLRALSPAVPPAIEAVVMRCLAKNPDHRFATCRDMRDALSPSAVAAGSAATIIETPVPVQPISGSGLLVAAATICVLCLGAFSVLTPGHGRPPAVIVLALAMFGIGTVIGGFWQDRTGPRVVAIVGAVLVALGFFVSYSGRNTEALVVGNSLLGGLGGGMAYICAIASAAKWSPQRRGLATGLVAAAFGSVDTWAWQSRVRSACFCLGSRSASRYSRPLAS